MFLILFDAFNERINICYLLSRCNKIEIFFLIFSMTLFVLLLIIINKENVIYEI